MAPPGDPADFDTAATNATSPDATHRAAVRRHLEIVATVVLSVATVLTAWSAFENAKWSGEQAIQSKLASASRTESVRASTLAGQQSVIDATISEERPQSDVKVTERVLVWRLGRARAL